MLCESAPDAKVNDHDNASNVLLSSHWQAIILVVWQGEADDEVEWCAASRSRVRNCELLRLAREWLDERVLGSSSCHMLSELISETE